MKKNKKYLVTAGIAAAALAVGGTAAFFTSTDSITNPFKTGSTTHGEDPNEGINVVEDFRTLATGETYGDYTNTNPIRGFQEYDTNPFVAVGEPTTYGELKASPGDGPREMLPGELFIKAMRVESEANYSQYLRIKVTVTVAGVTGEETDANGTFALGVDSLPTDLIIDADTTGWTLSSDGYFYYDTAFGPLAVTNDIVKAVMLDGVGAGNEWKNATISVKLEADAIQATSDAWASWAAADVTEPGTTPTPGP